MKLSIKLGLILLLLVLVEISSIILLRNHKHNYSILLGILGYLLVGCILAYILYNYPNLTIINTLWQVLNIVLVSFIGLFYFKEKLSFKEFLALFFAIISIILFL